MISSSSIARAVVALSLSLVACNTAKLTPAPDAGNPCIAPALEYPCKTLPASSPGCGADLGSGAVLGRDLALDGGAPAGCTVFVYDPEPDESGNCTTLGSCACDALDGGFVWKCSP